MTEKIITLAKEILEEINQLLQKGRMDKIKYRLYSRGYDISSIQKAVNNLEEILHADNY